MAYKPTKQFSDNSNFRLATLANARLQNSLNDNEFSNSDTNFRKAYNDAKFVNDYANEIYYGSKDPREEANAYNVASLITTLMPNINPEIAKKNYRAIMKGATGYDLDAKNILEIFGSKLASGYASQGLALNQIGYLIFNNGKWNPIDQEREREERKAFLSEATKYRRTDYFTEYDSLLERSFLDIGDVLPSSSASMALSLAGTAVGGLAGNAELGRKLGNAVSGVYNGLVEWGNLAVDLALMGADEQTQLAIGALHGITAGALEYSGDAISSTVLKPFGETMEAFSKKLGNKTVTKILDESFRSVLKGYRNRYIEGLITEPIEEMLQEASSMFWTNVANKFNEKKFGTSLENFAPYSFKDFSSSMAEIGKKTFEGQLLFGLTGSALSAVSDATKITNRKGEVKHYGKFRAIFDANKLTERTDDSRLELIGNVYTTKDSSFTPKDGEKVTIHGTTINGIFYPTSEDQSKANYIKKKDNQTAINVIDTKQETTGESVTVDEASRNATFLYDPEQTKVTDDGKIVVRKDNLNQAVQNFMATHTVDAIKEDGESVFIQYDGKVQEITTKDLDGTTAKDTDFYESYKNSASASDVAELVSNEKVNQLRKEQSRLLKTTNRAKENWYNNEISKITNDTEDLTALKTNRENLYNKYIESGRTKRQAESLSRVGSFLQAKFANILGEKVSDYISKVNFELLDSDTNENGERIGGRIVVKSDGSKTIYITKSNNETTAVHEIGHAFLSSVSDFSKIDGFAEAYSKEIETFNSTGNDTDLQEAFAKDLEVYIRDGYAKNEGLKRVFNQVIDALKEVIRTFSELSDEKITMFDKLFESENAGVIDFNNITVDEQKKVLNQTLTHSSNNLFYKFEDLNFGQHGLQHGYGYYFARRNATKGRYGDYFYYCEIPENGLKIFPSEEALYLYGKEAYESIKENWKVPEEVVNKFKTDFGITEYVNFSNWNNLKEYGQQKFGKDVNKWFYENGFIGIDYSYKNEILIFDSRSIEIQNIDRLGVSVDYNGKKNLLNELYAFDEEDKEYWDLANELENFNFKFGWEDKLYEKLKYGGWEKANTVQYYFDNNGIDKQIETIYDKEVSEYFDKAFDFLKSKLSEIVSDSTMALFERQNNNVDVEYNQTLTNQEEYDSLRNQLMANPKNWNGEHWLAPNGKISNLTEFQYIQVRTDAFKKWFGDWERLSEVENSEDFFSSMNSEEYEKLANSVSKVVDDNGEPLVVYIGSKKSGLQVLDPSYSTTGIDAVYGSNNIHIANTYTTYGNSIIDGESPISNKVYACFLNLKNPTGYFARESSWNDIRPMITQDGRVVPINESSTEENLNSEEENTDRMTTDEWIIQVLEEHPEENFDGAIIREVLDSNSWVYQEVADVYMVFDAKNIKSATANNGEFSVADERIYNQVLNDINTGSKITTGEKLTQSEIDTLDDETYQREMSIVEIVKNDEPVSKLAKKVLDDYLDKKKYTTADLKAKDYESMGKTFKKELLKGNYGYSEEALTDPAYLVKRINDYLAISNKEKLDLEFVAQFRNEFGNENISKLAKKLEKAGLFGEWASNVAPKTKQFSALELVAYRAGYGLSISKNLYSLALKEIKNNATFLRRYETIFDASGKQDISKMINLINEELLEERDSDEIKKTINNAMVDKDIPVEVKKEIREKSLTKNKVNALLNQIKTDYTTISELENLIDENEKEYQKALSDLQKASEEEKAELENRIAILKEQKRNYQLKYASQKRINAYNAIKLKLNAKIKKFEKLSGSSTLDVRSKQTIKNIYNALAKGEGNIFQDLMDIYEYKTDKKGNEIPATFDVLKNAEIIDDFGEVLKSFNDLTESEIDSVFESLNNDISTARGRKEEIRRENNHRNNILLTSIMNTGKVGTGEATPDSQEEIRTARKEVNSVTKDQSKTTEEKNKKSKPKRLMYEFLTQTRLFDKVDKMLGTKFRDTLYNGTKDFVGLNKAKDDFIVEKGNRVSNVIRKVLGIYGKTYQEGISGEKKNRVAWNNIVSDLANGEKFKLEEIEYDISQVEVELQKALKKAKGVINPTTGEYTKEQLIGIYLRAKNPNGIAHLSGTNMNINDKQIMWVVNEFENGQFQKEREVAMALMNEIGSKSKEISEVHYRRTGQQMAFEKYYYPNNTNEKKVSLEVGLGGDSFRKAIDSTFTIDRESDPNTSVNLNVLSSFERDIEKQEFYLTHAEMFDRINDVFYGSREDVGLYDLIGAEDKALADTIMDSLASMVYNSTSVNTEVSGFASRIIANSMAAKISYNISSVLQQPASLFLAVQKYSLPKTFAVLNKVIFDKEYRENLWAVAPQIRARSNMNIAIAKEMTKLAQKPIYKPIAKFIDAGMKPMEVTDLYIATALFGVAYEAEMQETGTSGYGSLASSKATQWVLDVQSSKDAKDSSLAYSKADTFMRVMLMFTNQLNKQFNMVADGVIQKNLSLLMSSLFATTLSSAWVVLATGKWVPSDDEEAYEKWAKELALENLSMLPVAGEKIQRVIEGYAYQQSDDIITRASELARAYTDDSKLREQKIKTAQKNLGVSMFDLAGLPSVEGRRVLNAIKGLTEGYNLGQALLTTVSTGYKDLAEKL